MPEVVFWDTSAFIALSNRDDRWYVAAVAMNQELARQRARILTTDAVLTEVANSFSRAAQKSVAQRNIDALQQSAKLGVARLIHVDEALWQRGWRLFTERPDKDWSLTDCISFIVMQENKVIRSFTSDHHFEQAGFVRLMQHALDNG